MARKYINLFDENGNPVRVPLGSDAENVDLEPINGLEAENVQEAIEELAGQQTTIDMDDVPTAGSNKAVKSGGVAAALAQKQDKLTSANSGNGISISEQGVISATGGGGSSVNIRGTIEPLSVTWQGGYINANGTAELSAQSSWKVTDLFTVSNKAGKYLFIPGYFDKKSAYEDWFMYSKFNSNSTLELVQTFNEWNRSYLIIPIKTDSESYRICMKKAYTNYGAVYLVDRDWLISAGYADAWAGKKWIMYGDSYVGGYPNGYTWHHTFAKKHYVNYIQNGYNGRGLVISAGENNDTLLTLLESTMLDNGQPLDVDIIGLTFGRNDYSKNVPIGNIDDMIQNIPANALSLTDYCVKSPGQAGYDEELANVTFMGGLNYLCNWLANNYPTKKVFFITPWYFINDYNHTVNTPVEYIDAVKTIAGKWGFPCFDAARQSGIHVQNVKFREDYFNESGSADTSHLKPAGHLLMAHGPVAAWLENLFRE